jgi:hypothetical protein
MRDLMQRNSLAALALLAFATPFAWALGDAEFGPEQQVWFANTTIDVNFPYKGGVIVPQPDYVLGGLSTNGFGTLNVVGTWPPGPFSGLSLYAQVWIVDPAGPFDLSATNGVVGTAP